MSSLVRFEPYHPYCEKPSFADCLIFLFVALAALLHDVPIRAQELAAASSLDEIVVTAQKRRETVLDVPISMTAISALTIERAGITDFIDYALKVPNLTFSYSGAQGITESLSIAIRGIQGAGTTGFYVDDLPLPQGVDPHTLDLSRIEVLRGPQGTLYGANSMGGTVRLITEAPDTTLFSGFGYAMVAGMDDGGPSYETSAGVDLPVREDLAARFSGFSLINGGFENRRFPDPIDPSVYDTVKDVAKQDEYGAALSLLWTPISELTIRPIVIYQYSHYNGLPLADYTASNRIQIRPFNTPEETIDEWTISGLTLNWHTGVGTMTSATSYFHRRDFELEDGAQVTALDLAYSPPLPTAVPTWQPQREFIEEIRFASEIVGAVQFVTGLYYDRETQGFEQNQVVPGLANVNGGVYGTDLAYFTNMPEQTDNKAVYGEATYSFASHWSAIAGLRYSTTNTNFTRVGNGIFNGGPSFDQGGASEHSLTPKGVLKYQPTEDQDYYLLAAKGFRPGGPNGPLPIDCAGDLAALGQTFTSVRSYDADGIWNYEVGAKTRFLDQRLSINTSLFWINWTKIQQLVRLPICGFNYTGNSGAARNKGVELEVSSAPLAGLTLTTGIGYTDARITEASLDVPLQPGQPVQQVAPWTISASVEYDYPIQSGWRGILRADDTYVDHSFSAANDQLQPRLREPYDILNLRIGVIDHGVETFALVKNATDARPNLSDNMSQVAELPGRPRIFTSLPRMYGIDMRVRF
jgi:iron complex outermembrane receptor protein